MTDPEVPAWLERDEPCNVPLNDALARLNVLDPGSVSFWREYVARWTVWNHVRTVACLLACAAFSLGLSRQS